MGSNITRTNEEFLQILKDKNILYIPLEEYKGGQTKIKWMCLLGHIFYAAPSTILRGNGCPYCANQKVLRGYNDLATTHHHLLDMWDFENNTISPYETTAKNKNKVWFKCIHGHSWQAYLYSASRDGFGCPYCGGHRVLKGFNDLWTTRPDIACLLKNPEDGYMVTEHSNKKMWFQCPQCHTDAYKSVNLITSHGLYCHFCSDGMSYAEKFVKNLLDQLNIKYIKDNPLPWSGQKRYDFYISDLSLIIETHGSQHYEQSKTFSRSLKEEQENDAYKKALAISNGIENYIELDCRMSDMEYIKNSIINSKISSFFNLSNVDWDECNNSTLTSNMILACNLFHNGESIDDIINILSVTRSTLIKYLKKGNECGLCKYDAEVIQKNTRQNFVENRKRKVICLETKVVFDSIKSAADFYNISPTSISEVCNGKKHRKTAGKYHWMFYDEYLLKNKEVAI